MTQVVVDASLAIKWAVPETFSDEATALLLDWQAQGVELIAPNWFASEIANVVFQRLKKGQLTLGEAIGALQDICALMNLLDVDVGDAVRALQIAHAMSQKASYDSQYLVLAERKGCELWTTDKHFWDAAHSSFPRIRWIGDIAS